MTIPRYAEILLPLPLASAYHYLIPADVTLQPGDFVSVPLGQRQSPAVVWNITDHIPPVDSAKLRPVTRRFDLPPMSEAMRQFIDWVANYTISPPGAVLKMAISVPDALDPPSEHLYFRAGDPVAPARITPQRQQVLDHLGDRVMALATLGDACTVKMPLLHAMVKAGLLIPIVQSEFGAKPASFPSEPQTLSPEQGAIAARLAGKVAAQTYSVTLLDGVTGSGKTEVYFAAIEAALQLGRPALVLLPEIGLSPQWIARCRIRFGFEPVVWHSGLTSKQRRAAWRRIAFGAANIIVGARSALFLPLVNIGLIVVDEEHDGSFKQSDGVLYQARDMAVVRARLGQCPIILASATPSLETMVNVASGRYATENLALRYGAAVLPRVTAIDLCRDPPPPGQFISPFLTARIDETLARGEQAMLFLNRRGYAPLTLCRGCGHRLVCPHCAAWLVEHRLRRELLCHHCGYRCRLPRSCPACGAEQSLTACGPGVERLAEEVATRWPDHRAAIMASDQVTARSAAELVTRMANREIDILIGTQMVAKGHHFPHLTLVGVVDADLSLSGGDLRAGERTFQLLHQVGGRAGRGTKTGKVYLQTTEPNHPVMAALVKGDRYEFIASEIAERKRFMMPPFGRLAALIVAASEVHAVEQAARALIKQVPHHPEWQIFGPAPAPLHLLRGRYRHRFLIKAPRDFALQAALKQWLAAVKLPRSIALTIDIDPYNFL